MKPGSPNRCFASRQQVHNYINDRHRMPPDTSVTAAAAHVGHCTHKLCRKANSRLRVELPEFHAVVKSALESASSAT